MKHLRALFVVFLLASFVLVDLPLSSAPAAATISDLNEYPGESKVICDFESYADETGPYGSWFFSTSYPTIHTNRSLSTNAVAHGSKSIHMEGWAYSSNTTEEARYAFMSSPTIDPLLIATPTIHYFLACPNPLPFNGTNSTIYLISMTLDANGSLLRSDNYPVTGFGQWTSQEFDIWEPGASSYYIAFVMSLNRTGPMHIYIDWMTAKSAPSNVRISYFNQFTGLGLNSELLIPVVTWGTQSIRVWNNEIVVAYGEQITISIKDYFNHVFLSVTLLINSTAVYVDVPVPLCKVYISRPDFYNSTLPPEWGVTYLPTGQRVMASGWELELISGWYQFDWSGNDLLADGELQAYVDGNATHRSSYSMQDFSLELKPTWSADGNTNSFLGGGGFSFENMTGWFSDILDLASVVYETQEFKLISVIGVGLMVFGWAIASKRKAEQLRKDETNAKHRSEERPA